MTASQLVATAERSLKLAKFKQATWGAKVNSAFLERKQQQQFQIQTLQLGSLAVETAATQTKST